jgi:hypothetical protein
MRVERRSPFCIALFLVFSSATLSAQDIGPAAVRQIADLTT